MRITSILPILTSASGVLGTFNPSSKSNVALYWGQNSVGQKTSQDRLSVYCENPNVDILIMAFLLKFKGMGGQPVMNFANQGDKCSVFPGTDTFSCSEIEADIMYCQEKGKTIMLSIGGDSYTEGGFPTAQDAVAAANKIWAMFGPPQDDNPALRPFGSASIDGFDFDLESTLQYGVPFAQQMLKNFESVANLPVPVPGRKFYLSAAPQCQFPDWWTKDLLQNVPMDWVHVQFYNNGCGVSSFVPGAPQQWNYNFNQWDDWARTSQNPNAKVLMGIPGGIKAGRGYMDPPALKDVAEFSANYSSFGGMMVWDASAAYANSYGNFLLDIKALLHSLYRRAVPFKA